MTSCVRPQWTKRSCYHCPSLQYPAPKPDEEINDLSECQCGVSPGLKHEAHRGKMGTPPPSVEWCCSVDLITHMQPQLNTCSSPSLPYCPLCKNKMFYTCIMSVCELCTIHHGCTNGQKYVDIPIFRFVLIPLAEVKVNLNATSYSDISCHYVLPTVWVRCFLAKHSNVSVPRVRSIQKVCVEELDWRAQRLTPTS